MEHTDAVTGERFFRVRLGHTYRDEYEGEDGRVYKRTTPATDTEEGLALEEELDEQGQVTRAWHVIDWPPQGMEVETEAEQAQEAEAEADEIGTWFA